jgi:hypothetical protein
MFGSVGLQERPVHAILISDLPGAYAKSDIPPAAGFRAGTIGVAERVGFEPTVRFHVHTRSRRAP